MMEEGLTDGGLASILPLGLPRPRQQAGDSQPNNMLVLWADRAHKRERPVMECGANSKLHICEVTDTEASSSEEEEEGDHDDDVFTELPLYGAFYSGLYKRTILLGKQDKCEHTRSQYVCHLDVCNDHSGKKLNDHEKEEKQMDMVTQPEKGSEWSDSMSSLMKKLEQLNLDIEEALSAGSSPSSTPSTKKRKQPDSFIPLQSPVKVETGLVHRDHQRKGSCGNKRAGYQDLDGLPSSVSTGARPKTELEGLPLSLRLKFETLEPTCLFEIH
ncbi:unnamed protein product [Caretta caretta]